MTHKEFLFFPYSIVLLCNLLYIRPRTHARKQATKQAHRRQPMLLSPPPHMPSAPSCAQHQRHCFPGTFCPGPFSYCHFGKLCSPPKLQLEWKLFHSGRKHEQHARNFNASLLLGFVGSCASRRRTAPHSRHHPLRTIDERCYPLQFKLRTFAIWAPVTSSAPNPHT